MGILPSPPPCILYFGCYKETGHYVRTPQNSPFSLRNIPHGITDWFQSMDGTLHSESSNRWVKHEFECSDGKLISVIAKKDNSVDTRPGSWAGFLIPGEFDLQRCLVQAKHNFPELSVWK